MQNNKSSVPIEYNKKSRLGIRKADAALLVVIITLAVFFYAYSALQPSGALVSVFSDGKLFGEYSLDSDMEVEVINAEGHINVVEIKNGRVGISSADCPDELCVRHSSVSRTGASVVCIPNRLSVKVSGENELDSVVY